MKLDFENIRLFSIIFFTGILTARLSYPLLKYIIFKISRKSHSSLKEKLQSLSKTPYALLVLCAFWYMALHFLSFENTKWTPFIYNPLKIIFTYSLLVIIYQILDILEIYISHLIEGQKLDTIHQHFLPYSKKLLKIVVPTVAILIVLQNAGYNVTSLLAGLGIGGVAIALAAKETLSNLLGGIIILVDKPFSVGDWINCNDIEGTVEDIGFRSTKIKTFYDSIVILPNAMISDSVIDNLGKRKFRRTQVTLDLTYDTTPEKIEAFLEGIKSILKNNSYVRQDYHQIYFSGYASSSLQIFMNFFLKVKDWDEELSQRQNIFLEILKLSKTLGVSFAFPTQTLDIPSLPPISKN